MLAACAAWHTCWSFICRAGPHLYAVVVQVELFKPLELVQPRDMGDVVVLKVQQPQVLEEVDVLDHLDVVVIEVEHFYFWYAAQTGDPANPVAIQVQVRLLEQELVLGI